MTASDRMKLDTLWRNLQDNPSNLSVVPPLTLNRVNSNQIIGIDTAFIYSSDIIVGNTTTAGTGGTADHTLTALKAVTTDGLQIDQGATASDPSTIKGLSASDAQMGMVNLSDQTMGDGNKYFQATITTGYNGDTSTATGRGWTYQYIDQGLTINPGNTINVTNALSVFTAARIIVQPDATAPPAVDYAYYTHEYSTTGVFTFYSVLDVVAGPSIEYATFSSGPRFDGTDYWYEFGIGGNGTSTSDKTRYKIDRLGGSHYGIDRFFYTGPTVVGGIVTGWTTEIDPTDVTGTAGASYGATEQTMLDDLKARVNAILATFRNMGIYV